MWGSTQNLSACVSEEKFRLVNLCLFAVFSLLLFYFETDFFSQQKFVYPQIIFYRALIDIIFVCLLFSPSTFKHIFKVLLSDT